MNQVLCRLHVNGLYHLHVMDLLGMQDSLLHQVLLGIHSYQYPLFFTFFTVSPREGEKV